ncbi:hypothetical protein MLD38_014826 [Melastoma candidum]|uniref:Uncharacterized protein n=1 Tax=Melastoma candidum TaxID=119954 RepID=A0ACB9RDW8_9MYRT|nr:hypothetical protein MLD38_014826 [Melastoma candidum]
MVVATGNNRAEEAFVDGVGLAWAVHLMLIQDAITPSDRLTNVSSSDLQKLHSCVDIVFKNNVFQSLLDNVLKTAAYQNEDEDMIYMYHAYLHKLFTCLLTHLLARDKVKEAKEKAMDMFIPHRMVEYLPDRNSDSQQVVSNPSFVSLLEENVLCIALLLCQVALNWLGKLSLRIRSPDTSTKLSEVIPTGKFQLLAEEILSNPATSKNGGIYYYIERSDRLIDLASFSDKL